MQEYVSRAKKEADSATTDMGSSSMMRRVTVRVPIQVQASLQELDNNPQLCIFHIPPKARIVPRDETIQWDTNNIVVESSVLRGPDENTFPLDIGFQRNFLPTGYHTSARQREIETVERVMKGDGSYYGFSVIMKAGCVDADASAPLVKGGDNRLNGRWVVSSFGCFSAGEQLFRGTMQLDRNACQAMDLPPPPGFEKDQDTTWVLCREPHILTWLCRTDERTIAALGMGALRFGAEEDGYWLMDSHSAMFNTKLFWQMAASQIDHRRVQDLEVRMCPARGNQWMAGVRPDSEDAHCVYRLKFTWVITYLIFPQGANRVAVPTMAPDMPDVATVLRLRGEIEH